jgi:hypothetical protein
MAQEVIECFLLLRIGFNLKPVRVGFVVDGVILGVLRTSPISAISPVLHNHRHYLTSILMTTLNNTLKTFEISKRYVQT